VQIVIVFLQRHVRQPDDAFHGSWTSQFSAAVLVLFAAGHQEAPAVINQSREGRRLQFLDRASNGHHIFDTGQIDESVSGLSAFKSPGNILAAPLRFCPSLSAAYFSSCSYAHGGESHHLRSTQILTPEVVTVFR
jgi:hypothetical protein